MLTIIGLVIAAILAGTVLYFAGRLTVSALKKYRKKKSSKLLAATVRDMAKKANVVKLDDLEDDEIILAEYSDEDDELVQDICIAKDVDANVETILKENGGIVVFE